jgi:hypothetical protein
MNFRMLFPRPGGEQAEDRFGPTKVERVTFHVLNVESPVTGLE